MAFEGFDSVGRRGAEAVVGDEEGGGLASAVADAFGEGGFGFWRERILGLAVDAEYLLRGGVSPAGEEARFGRSGPAFDDFDAGKVDFASFEIFEEHAARFIVANRANGKRFGAERGDVVDGIGAAAGKAGSFAMAENQDGGFARDAGNFAGDEFVEDEVGENGNFFAAKFGDDFEKVRNIHGGRVSCGLSGFLARLNAAGLFQGWAFLVFLVVLVTGAPCG